MDCVYKGRDWGTYFPTSISPSSDRHAKTLAEKNAGTFGARSTSESRRTDVSGVLAHPLCAHKSLVQEPVASGEFGWWGPTKKLSAEDVWDDPPARSSRNYEASRTTASEELTGVRRLSVGRPPFRILRRSYDSARRQKSDSLRDPFVNPSPRDEPLVPVSDTSSPPPLRSKRFEVGPPLESRSRRVPPTISLGLSTGSGEVS